MRKSAFTLIEIVVVIAVAGILTAVAIPGFSKWLPDYRLKSAARDLYSNMQLAKIGAVKSNARWAIVFNAALTPGRYYICSADGNNNTWDGPAEIGGDDVVENTIDLSDCKSGVDYGHGNAGVPIGGTFDNEITYIDDVLVFYPRGTCSLGYVYLENSGKAVAYGVGTSISGVITFRKWTGGVWK